MVNFDKAEDAPLLVYHDQFYQLMKERPMGSFSAGNIIYQRIDEPRQLHLYKIISVDFCPDQLSGIQAQPIWRQEAALEQERRCMRGIHKIEDAALKKARATNHYRALLKQLDEAEQIHTSLNAAAEKIRREFGKWYYCLECSCRVSEFDADEIEDDEDWVDGPFCPHCGELLDEQNKEL